MSVPLSSLDADRRASPFDHPDGGLRPIGEILPLVVARYGIDPHRVQARRTPPVPVFQHAAGAAATAQIP